MKSKILPKTMPIHLPFSKDNHYSMVAWVAFPDIFITPICKSVFVFNRNCSVLHEQLICFQMQVGHPYLSVYKKFTLFFGGCIVFHWVLLNQFPSDRNLDWVQLFSCKPYCNEHHPLCWTPLHTDINKSIE